MLLREPASIGGQLQISVPGCVCGEALSHGRVAKGDIFVNSKPYKYMREDFPGLPVTLNHLTIYLNFLDESVQAHNCLDITAVEPLERISLDAKALEILSVEWLEPSDVPDGPGRPLEYQYLETEDKLIVTLPSPAQKGDRFVVRTVTRCVPSDHILEGIYKDTTPPGAPQQYMSQCQQWGFQRIAPVFDDCRAKCTMTTTIEADARYTHLISNGNISKTANPEGKPVPKPADSGRQMITYENTIPMAPYLFIACVGTWDMLVDKVTLPSGKLVRLEYLVPMGRTADAAIPMAILKDSVRWIAETQGYEYTADTYRTICMNKSNFGGMENVGNTTIVTDAALIDEHTLDYSLLYAHGVIVHEFEHNQCGSETTMETPFDVWLNEAYTVDVERQYLAHVFDPTFMRLNQVDSIRSPLLGPLAIEDAGVSGRIVRAGFNNPDDLIDAVTYVKAAEVIRMLRLILGTEAFHAGKTLYFSRYRHSNADTDKFFDCFEEVGGRSLDQFKKTWLYTIGYPQVTATTVYDSDNRRFTVRFTQSLKEGQSPFHLPIEVALVDKEGRTVKGSESVFQLADAKGEFTLEDVDQPPAFASLNGDYSFYGTFVQSDADWDTLVSQARLDPNAFNRVEAMRRLTDVQRTKLLDDPQAEIDQDWLAIYGEFLRDKSISPGLKPYFLRIDEQPLNRSYSTWYRELVLAKEAMMLAVNAAFRSDLAKLFHSLDTYRKPESPKDGIEERILKGVLLGLITVDDSLDSQRLILDHYRKAVTASDRVAALTALNRSSAPDRLKVLEEVYEAWHPHLSGYANYLRVISYGTQPDLFHMIKKEQERPTFDANQPTWSRALFLTLATNTKMVWTDEGIDWVREKVSWLSRINDYTAGRLLNTFQHCRQLKPDLRRPVTTALESILKDVPPDVSPTIHGQAKAYLG